MCLKDTMEHVSPCVNSFYWLYVSLLMKTTKWIFIMKFCQGQIWSPNLQFGLPSNCN